MQSFRKFLPQGDAAQPSIAGPSARQRLISRLELPPLSRLRKAPEWTIRSAKLLGCMVGALLLLFGGAALPGAARHSLDAGLDQQQQQQQLQGRWETAYGDGVVVGGALPPPPPRLLEPVLLHQTQATHNLTAQMRSWQHSWEVLGFRTQLADNAHCREDMRQLVALTGVRDYLTVYDALETAVQRSDMWRYAALYLFGGVYADIDVVAEPAMAELLNSNMNRSGVVFVESLPSPWLIGFIARFFYLTDMVRIPQYRNCIMIACRGHPALRATLDAIVSRFKFPPPHRSPEPTHTLELTGPGIFTDSVKASSQSSSALSPPLSRSDALAAAASATASAAALAASSSRRAARKRTADDSRSRRVRPLLGDDAADAAALKEANSAAAAAAAAADDEGVAAPGGVAALEAEAEALGPMLTISRLAGHKFFTHLGQGSWKTYRTAWAERSGATEKGGEYAGRHRALEIVGLEMLGGQRKLERHEVRLRSFFCLLLLLLPLAFALYRLRKRGALSAQTLKERWALARVQAVQAKAKLAAPLQRRRGMLWQRAVQTLALVVVLSGLRSQCGAVCLNPWRVVGFWLSTFEQAIRAPPPPPSYALSRRLPSLELAVLGCGEAPGATFGRSLTIDAVEELGRHFRAYSVHLFIQLVASPSEPYDNTRNVLTAWAVRNPAVQLHALRSVPLDKLTGRLPLPGSPEHAARIAGLRALRQSAAATVRGLPRHVEHVLMLDLESPTAFLPAALVEALTWERRWDAVCAATMGSDGVLSDLPHLYTAAMRKIGGGDRSDHSAADDALGAADDALGAAAAAAAAASSFAAALLAANTSQPASAIHQLAERNSQQQAQQAKRTMMVRSGALRVRTCSSSLALYHRSALRECVQSILAAADAGTADAGTAAAAPVSSASSASYTHHASGYDGGEEAAAAGGGGGRGRQRGGGGPPLGGGGSAACERTALHECMAAHGHERLYALPSLGLHRSAPHEDVQYLLITLLMLLPALAPCVAFCKRWLTEYLPADVHLVLPGFKRRLLAPLGSLIAKSPLGAASSRLAATIAQSTPWASLRASVIATAARHVLVRRKLLATLAFVVLLQVALLCRQLHSATAASDGAASMYDASLARFRRSLSRHGGALLASGAVPGAGAPGDDDAYAVDDPAALLGYEAAVGDEYDGRVGLLIPLVLPCLTAIDLIVSERSGPLTVRLPAAALALLTPLFVLLELRRLHAIELPELPAAAGAADSAGAASGEGGHGADLLAWLGSAAAGWVRQPWPSSLGLCDASLSCTAP